MRALILEDDLGFALDIEILLNEIGDFEVDIAADSTKAEKAIQSNSPNLLLLDVRVKGNLNGIEFYQKYQSLDAGVVFFTAYNDEAIYQKARAISNAPYLIKPFDRLTLKAAIEAVLQKKSSYKDHIMIKKRNEYIRILLEHILWIKAEGNYSYIYTQTEKYIVKSSTRKLLTSVKRDTFLAIHKGIIINPNYVQTVNFSNNLLRINDQELPIGRTYHKNIRKVLKL
ncbi:MAG: LytTR family DNA-binding domain-containing protein [Bacteroidota bacterium]